MTRKELRAIVKRHGGTRAFATNLKVSQRIVQLWLKGERRIRPVIEHRILDLEKRGDNPTLRRLTKEEL